MAKRELSIYICIVNDQGSTSIEEPIPPELRNIHDSMLLRHKYCLLRKIDPDEVEEFQIR